MKNVYALVVLVLMAPLPCLAQAMILDAELTNSFEKLAAPLKPHLPHTEATRFVVVADPTLNAFATPENIVYLHSGIIEKMDNQEELRGVIAHEMGHISHLDFLGLDQASKRTTLGMLGGMVAGMGAAVAGAPQAAAAIMAGTQAGGISAMMAHTRVQEQVADQTAKQALLAAGLDTKGMASMFDKLRIDMQLSYDVPPPYLMTHPLAANRAGNLRSISDSRIGAEAAEPMAATPEFLRLQAKTYALSHTPAQTLRTFSGTTFADRYARMIARLRMGDTQGAKEILATLDKDKPGDPWLNDMHANIAYAENDFGEALAIWQDMLRQYPDNAILAYRAAEAAKAAGKRDEAMALYQKVVRLWPDWSEAWYGLGVIYGEKQLLISSHLALSESYLGAYDKREALESLRLARYYATQAKPTVSEQGWLEDLGRRLEKEESRLRNTR